MSTQPKHTRTLDVRPLIARGEEPFGKIMAAVATVGLGESLVVVTPFLPAPLIEKLRGEGFSAAPERRPDAGWQTRFTRES